MLTVLDDLAEFCARPDPRQDRRRPRPAIAGGVKMGRKPKLTQHQQKKAIKRRDWRQATREIARSYNVSRSDFEAFTLA